MVKILITGSKGQVGTCLVKQLNGKAEILAVDREELDITDRDAVFKTVQDFRPQVIINAAAHTAVDRAETELELSESINVKGPQYLAEASNEIGALMLHISTDYVFNGEGSHEYKESDQTDPQGVYGKTKLAGELAVQQVNPRTIILRTAWVFCEHGNNFVKTMLRLGIERESLGIVGDQFGGPTYAGDIATALIEITDQILAGKENAFGIYHFTGKPYVSWYEFARVIFNEAKLQKIIDKRPVLKNISTSDYPTPAKRPANSRLNLTKIQQEFNIEPSNWKNALKKLESYSL